MRGKSIMQTIQQRYEEIRNEQELTEKIDKLIVDCYHYKIFKEKASARYKKEFKDDFERDYPVYVSDITKKLPEIENKKVNKLINIGKHYTK